MQWKMLLATLILQHMWRMLYSVALHLIAEFFSTSVAVTPSCGMHWLEYTHCICTYMTDKHTIQLHQLTYRPSYLKCWAPCSCRWSQLSLILSLERVCTMYLVLNPVVRRKFIHWPLAVFSSFLYHTWGTVLQSSNLAEHLYQSFVLFIRMYSTRQTFSWRLLSETRRTQICLPQWNSWHSCVRLGIYKVIPLCALYQCLL